MKEQKIKLVCTINNAYLLSVEEVNDTSERISEFLKSVCRDNIKGSQRNKLSFELISTNEDLLKEIGGYAETLFEDIIIQTIKE